MICFVYKMKYEQTNFFVTLVILVHPLQCNQDPGYSIYCNSGSLTLPTSAQRVHLNSQPLWQSQLEDQTIRIFWSNPNTYNYHQIKSKYHLSSPVLQWILTPSYQNLSDKLVLHVLVHEITFSKPNTRAQHDIWTQNNFCSTTSWFQCGSWLYFESKGGRGWQSSTGPLFILQYYRV